jgi:hypothetical protein
MVHDHKLLQGYSPLSNTTTTKKQAKPKSATAFQPQACQSEGSGK